MNIHINGQPFKLTKNTSIHDALDLFLTKPQQQMSYAVALNSEFVSKSQYALTYLKNSDSIDVLFPIHGG